MYRYKKCGNCLVTLIIPDYAITNENRKNIVNPLIAKYRTNIAYVYDICDINDENIKLRYCYSTFHKNFLRYQVGKFVNAYDFNPNLEKVCASGIHYFISKDVAKNYTGTKEIYYKNNNYIYVYNSNGKLLWIEQYNKGRIIRIV
jgi:hypothetical protein